VQTTNQQADLGLSLLVSESLNRIRENSRPDVESGSGPSTCFSGLASPTGNTTARPADKTQQERPAATQRLRGRRKAELRYSSRSKT